MPSSETRETGPSAAITGILRYLQERRLQPGDRLPSERDLAERLGVGRNAVREALATLVTLRMVESRPNSGIYLRHMSRESSFEVMVMLAELGAPPADNEIVESMEVRAHLETLSVRLACERRNDEDLARLQVLLQQADEVLLFEPAGMKWSLAETAKHSDTPAYCYHDVESIVQQVKSISRPGDHVLVMSNGGFEGIHQRLLDALASAEVTHS